MVIGKGWATAEREIEGALVDQVVERASGIGFTPITRDVGQTVLRRGGAHLAARSSSMPLELTLSETEEGVRARLRYDTFVVFDTGDLEELLDRLIPELSGHG